MTTRASDDSSSSSSDDAVLITKQHRKKFKSDKPPAPLPATPLPKLKPDHICGVCEREGGDLVVCTGSCVSAFHAACLSLEPVTARDAWKCPNCTAGTHVCFHCKQRGRDADAEDDGTASSPKVVKCRALSCGKFYHHDCIAKLPLARIAGARFICPLHTCAACEQSGGAKKEPVRCTRCPVAYHTSCLPRTGVVPLPGKRIICPKHDGEAPPVLEEEKEAKAVEEGEVEEGEEAEEGEEVDVKPTLSRAESSATAENESVAASSPRTEENDDDARSDTSASAKKHSKSSKKDKKKKKKKRKKDKKKEKERSERDDATSDDKKKKSKSSRTADHHHSDDEGSVQEEDERAEKTVHTATEGDKGDQNDETLLSAESLEPKNDAVVVTEPEDAQGDAATGHVKAEPEDEAPAPISTTTAADVKPESPAPDANEDVAATVEASGERAVAEHEHEAEVTASVTETPGVAEPLLPVKEDPSDQVHEEKDVHDHLTVKIPEVMADDVEGDDDSGSGSGSQSTKARHGAVKEKSGGSSRSKKSKKKRKGGKVDDTPKRGDVEQDGVQQPRDEAKWVQCDACKKWRTVAKEIDLDAMPETWYCKMNTWNKAFASCDVPEEVIETKQSSKPTKRSAGGLGEAVTPVPKKAKLTKQSSTSELPAPEIADAGTSEKDKNAAGKPAKKADKDSKKRKLKLKLREKYGEVNWVQCENKQCGKWRVVPSSANALPSVWYCNLNTWAPELASCSAANPPEVEAYLAKSQSKKPSSTRPPKRQRGPDNAQDQSGATGASSQPEVATKPSGSRPSKGGAKGATPTSGGAASGAGGNAGAVAQGAVGVDDGRGANVLVGVKSVVLEWAQCEKCLKWRKLPAHIKSSTLPDKWYCSMNHWDPSRASCALPQEEDQEPIDASPLPSSQNWYPMPGQVGGSGSTGGSSVRTKRGKLSYSELLFASTGQLRKTYTSDSSTLSFEYEGVVYQRDDQYKKSSMYISPLTTNKLTGEQIDPQSEAAKVKGPAIFQFVAPAMQEAIDRVSKVILSKIDLRREFAITEIVDGVLTDSNVASGDLSLSVITSAIAQLVTAGELEKVDRSSLHAPTPVEASTTTSILLGSLSSQPAYYRKVPKRPLKALKAWKLAASL